MVIGLGVFGATIARELTRLGPEVLGLDADEQRVDRLAEEITHAVIADVTDKNALVATRIIAPEYEMGIRISQELNYPMVHDYLGLNDDYFIVDFQTTDDLTEKTIGEIINGEPVEALVVKRMKEAHPHPDHTWKIRNGDRLVLAGQIDDLRDLVNRL